MKRLQSFELHSRINNLLLLAVLPVLLLTSCSVNSTFNNRIEDKKEAEKITTQLFDFIKRKDFESASKLFGKRFYEVTEKEKLMNLLTITAHKLGGLKRTEVKTWETQVVIGTNPSSNYTLVYTNEYEKFSAHETIRLSKESDGKIKIYNYKIESDGFINM